MRQIRRSEYITSKQGKIEEAKKIVASLIGCKYVDGINLYLGKQYYGGVYCDDLAQRKYPHWGNLDIGGNVAELYGTIVVINEVGGLDPASCEEIKRYLIKNISLT